MPEFFDVVLNQRACRAFRDDPVPDELIDRLLEAATHAPSAENRQPWVFVVLRDPDQRAAVAELTRKAWRGGGRQFSEDRLTPGLLAEVDRGAEGGVGAAPVIVVVCGDTQRGLETVMGASVFPAVQNLLLAAAAVGLGSALTTLPVGDELAAVMDLPSHIKPYAVIPLGWPGRPLGPPRRDPPRTYSDRWSA